MKFHDAKLGWVLVFLGFLLLLLSGKLGLLIVVVPAATLLAYGISTSERNNTGQRLE